MTHGAWLPPDALIGSALPYRVNSTFRATLKKARKERSQLEKAIEKVAMISVHERPSETLRARVSRYLRSYSVQLITLHDEFVKDTGFLRHLCQTKRQAAFFYWWRHTQSGGRLPYELDPSKPCREPFAIRGMPKERGSGFRTLFSFGLARTVRQRMVETALDAAMGGQLRAQYLYGGGRLQAITDIVAALQDNPALTHWAVFDLAQCFDHINLAHCHEVLPVKGKVVQHTIGVNRKEAIDYRERDHVRDDRYRRAIRNATSGRCSQVFATRYPLTLPQGAACSPRVAYSLIEEGMPPLHWLEFMYGDDFLILGESKQVVAAKASDLEAMLRKHPAGPLQVGFKEVGTLADGVEFLGISIMRDDTENPLRDGVSVIEIRLADDRRDRFLDKFRAKLSSGIACADLDLYEANLYLKQVLLASPAAAHASIVRDAVDAATPFEVSERFGYKS